MDSQIKKDAELIEQLGGPTKLAQILGYEMPIGVQRVSNWRTRGIPAKVKVDRPDLFLNRYQEAA
jgi:hypothetical protein